MYVVKCSVFVESGRVLVDILVACFRHRAINLFMQSYRDLWIAATEAGHSMLVEDITVSICSLHALVTLDVRCWLT